MRTSLAPDAPLDNGGRASAAEAGEGARLLVLEQQSLFAATVVLIEDKASGTQLIQELITDGCHGVTDYQPTGDKIMRLYAQTAMIENGFVHIPKRADLGNDPFRWHVSRQNFPSTI
jgi:predicted phage terminase large subunit-like protein